MNERLREIRENEAAYHAKFYSDVKLYEPGSWMAKPVKSVISAFEQCEQVKRALDLGSGAGRNTIWLAQQLENGRIDAVDILPEAVDKLKENAEMHHLSNINCFVEEIEHFNIQKEYYDLIIGVSAIEHVSDLEKFQNVLYSVAEGLKHNGIACLIINTNVQETHQQTKQSLSPQFEVNISSEQLEDMLKKIFNCAEWLKYSVQHQTYIIERSVGKVMLETDVVTLIIRKTRDIAGK